ncbi:YSIRK-type signal peptide-containing protein [Staphylococcus pseudintermedius]|nr:YSIRK-type signal peptide-containing protein [Staphylococcus pseudintermedius]
MLRTNYKLRKLKVGLVSTGVALTFVMASGNAEASENEQTEVKGEAQVASVNEKESEAELPVAQQEASIQLDKVQPGDAQLSGYTQPNKAISVKIDNKDIVSVDDGYEEVLSDDTGKFVYDLKGRQIVYNQKVDVEAMTPFNFEDFDESALESEEALEALGQLEDEETATASVTTPRYEGAYTVPEERLTPIQGQQQVFIEPILEGASKIKGHTSVQGKVALAINQEHVHLGDTLEEQAALTDQEWQGRYDGIWRHIDDQGFFEFDLNRLYNKSYPLKSGDLVTLSFKSNDEVGPLFNVNVEPFERVAQAKTKYEQNDSTVVNKLDDTKSDLEVQPIYGDLTQAAVHGESKVLIPGTSKVEGRTNYAHAWIEMASNLGEYRSFPTLQADATGAFIFDLKAADIQLLNGERLTFRAVDPHTKQQLAETTSEVRPVDMQDEESEVVQTSSTEKSALADEILRSMTIDKSFNPEVTEIPGHVYPKKTEDKGPENTEQASENSEKPSQTTESQNDAVQDVEKSSVNEEVTPPSTESAQVEKGQNTEGALLPKNVEQHVESIPYQKRKALIGLTKHQGSGHMPPFSLSFNNKEDDVSTKVNEANEHERKQGTVYPEQIEQLPQTGLTEKSPFWALLFVVSGTGLLLFKRSRRQRQS